MATSLREWAREYACHRQKSRGVAYELLESSQNVDFVIKTSTKQEGYSVCEDLDHLSLAQIPPMAWFVVTLHTKKNNRTLIERWKEYAAKERLVLVFVNPESKNEKYWIIHPSLHDAVADPATLKAGLASMAGLVDFVE